MEKIKKIIPNITQYQLKALEELIGAEYERGKNEANETLKKETFEKRLDGEIADAGAKNTAAVKALLDLEGIEADESVLKSELERVKKECPYLFKEEDEKPHFTGAHAKRAKTDKNAFENMSYKKRLKLFSDNPDLYRQLAGR